MESEGGRASGSLLQRAAQARPGNLAESSTEGGPPPLFMTSQRIGAGVELELAKVQANGAGYLVSRQPELRLSELPALAQTVCNLRRSRWWGRPRSHGTAGGRSRCSNSLRTERAAAILFVECCRSRSYKSTSLRRARPDHGHAGAALLLRRLAPTRDPHIRMPACGARTRATPRCSRAPVNAGTRHQTPRWLEGTWG